MKTLLIFVENGNWTQEIVFLRELEGAKGVDRLRRHVKIDFEAIPPLPENYYMD